LAAVAPAMPPPTTTMRAFSPVLAGVKLVLALSS
jgi:hypothetical protein